MLKDLEKKYAIRTGILTEINDHSYCCTKVFIEKVTDTHAVISYEDIDHAILDLQRWDDGRWKEYDLDLEADTNKCENAGFTGEERV